MLQRVQKRVFHEKWKSSHRGLRTSTFFTVDNPYSGEVVCEVPWVTANAAEEMINQANHVQKEWAHFNLSKRQDLCTQWIQTLQNNADRIAREVSQQMGKPLKQAHGEINGTMERARALIELSSEVLATDVFPEKNGLFRQIVKEPVGVVFVIAPWNYPLLTVVNSVIPALLCGNAVVIKHSPRTPLCGNHYVDTMAEAGLPTGLVSSMNASHEVVAHVLQRPEIGFVSFTGSVRGGREVNQTCSSRFINTTFELGGKDPGYVAEDADVKSAAAGLIDGAFYNAGQSCCAIERVYVHESQYETFLKYATELVNDYKMGDPFHSDTSLGPLALPNNPKFLQKQVEDALSKGARLLTKTGISTGDSGQARFFVPTLLADGDHSMSIMTEESFGPVLCVASVSSDAEAVQKMNDSNFGLTAAIFTSSKERAMTMASQLNAGTVYMNRCDALDPFLPWGGLKDTGKGTSLSKYGFTSCYNLKAFNFRVTE